MLTEQQALEMKLTPEDFKHVDIYSRNRLDQISGKSNGYLVSVLKRFAKNKWALFFFIILLIIVLLAIIVPYASPYSAYDPISTNSFATSLRPRWPGGLINGYYETLMSPTFYDQMKSVEGFIIGTPKMVENGDYLVTINPYALPELKNVYPIFGTDARGVDIWTKTWQAAAISLQVAVAVAIVSIILGAIYGAISGACAGTKYDTVDTVMMRIVEILSGVPTILWLLILSSIIVIGNNAAGTVDNNTLLVSLICIIWMGPAITTRTYILKTKDAEYIQAVRTLGGSQPRIIFIHMLPNISGRLLVRFVNIIPAIIFYESTLVFLGIKSKFDLGIGTLIDEGYQVSEYITPLLAPSLVLVVLTLSSQIVANGINDAIDPRVSAGK